MKSIYFDLDGTLARFHDRILDDKGLVKLDLMYQVDFFRSLEPFSNMVEAVRLLMEKHPEYEIYILSAVPDDEIVEQKNDWVDEFLPELDVSKRIYVKPGETKGSVIKNADSYLIDDFNKNLAEWVNAGGHPIKCRNNVNHAGKARFGGDFCIWQGDLVYNMDPPEKIIADLEAIIGL